MKRYILLGAATCLALFGTMFLGKIFSGSAAWVELTTMQTERYAETVYAAGEVTETEKSELVAELPLVISAVHCKNGSKVSAGDVLFTVDQKATKEYWMTLASETFDLSESALIVSLLRLLSENAEQELSNLLPSALTAPRNGIVTRVNVSKNTAVLPGELLAVVAESDEFRVTLSVPEEEVSKVCPGQSVIMTGLSSESFTGRVHTVSDTVKKQFSGTSFESVVEVTVEPDRKPNLRAGSSISAEIELGEPRQVNLLPYEAVGQDEQGREYVYLYRRSDGKVEKRPVLSGAETSDGIEIVEGIYPSDLVVLDVSSVSGEEGVVNVLGRVGG